MWTLKLCKTSEYHPFILEHWLSSLQKKRQKFSFRWRRNGDEFRLETSHDFSNIFEGSSAEKSLLKNPPPPRCYARTLTGHLLPLKRYRQMEDRFNKIRIFPTETALRDLGTQPDAYFEIQFSAIPDLWRHRALHWAKRAWFRPDGILDQWESQHWFKTSLRPWIGAFLRLLRPYRNIKPTDEKTETLHEREDPHQAVLDKLSRPLFRVKIVSNQNIQSFLGIFNWPYLGQMGVTSKPSELILSAEELAGILATPRLNNHEFKILSEPCRYLKAPPSALNLSEEDVKRHRYVIGKTGTGKSTLLEQFFLKDLKRGGTAILLDPHGDLAENIFRYLPETELHRLLIIDPKNPDQVPAYNPLECANLSHATRQSSMLLEVFQILAQGSWGPRLEYILRNALLTLTLSPNRTLLDLPNLLQNRDQSESWLSTVEDPELHRFWKQEFWAMPEKNRQEAIHPILNKVGPLLTHPTLRNMLSQPKGKLNWTQIIESKKILLVPLSKGILGDDLSRMMGLMFLAGIQSALLNQAEKDNSERTLTHLTLDECHHFATPTLMSMLSESRKYGLALTLAHQYLEQMPLEQQKAILGNVGALAVFQTCPEDATALAPFLELQEADLMNLPPLQFYWKHGPTVRLNLERAPLPPQKDLHLWQWAQNSLSRNRAYVEAKVRERYNKRSNSPP